MRKGRKAYNKTMVDSLLAAAEMARVGYTDEAVADFIGCTRRSVMNWRDKHDEFREALLDIRTPVDQQVEHSLFQLAVGFETTETKVTRNADGEILKTEETTKTVAPNPTSCIFWLKNRDRERWRDVKEHVNQPNDDNAEEANLLEVARRILFAITAAEHTKH